MQAKNILNDFKPHVAVGVGGYASFPLLYIAQQKKIATLIQEQNSFAGKSNKILGKKAQSICVAYNHMETFFPANKILLTGNPVRNTIADSQITQEQGKEFFKLHKSKQTVFVIGGSLGAKSINESISANFKLLLEQNIQVIWQTGVSYLQTAKDVIKGNEDSIKVFDFIRDINYAYAAADIIVSRAGASSISELCIVGKPVIFVPYPFASEDHQTFNAKALVNVKAALIVEDEKALTKLVECILNLVKDDHTRNEMCIEIKKLATLHADERIAHKIIEIAN